MPAPRQSQTKEIFLQAIELRSEERPQFLRKACGDDRRLRTTVESLLKASRVLPADFLEPPEEVARAAALARTAQEELAEQHLLWEDDAGSEAAGDVFGPYTLLSKIGEGGFGVVWRAQQREPIERQVAIKLIKLGMDTRQVIARFEAERGVLALMDHPNIATVLDAGSTEEGRPYFVMELVEGEPLLTHCERERLDIRARLQLFAKVCRAIQHAHRKGIIHRDIKPSNVLIAIHDGEATPKIIDFGIAKAIGDDGKARAALTQQRQLLGTPAYMAPEQFTSGGESLDTRADVYSLGVLLYELLTGMLPYRAEALLYANFAEVARIICEEEPLRPSARIAPPQRRALIRQKAGERSHLSFKAVQGDLDWIVIRCLEKDRARRYDSAGDLAEEILRHLENQPVLAGPPSFAYRGSKFLRRHRTPVVLAGTLALALLTFLITGFYWTSRQNRILDEQNGELTRQKIAAQKALEDVGRLSDARVLSDLIERAKVELWPALPDKIAAMEAWLKEAEALAARIPAHEQMLLALPKTEPGGETAKSDWLHDLLSDIVRQQKAFSDPVTGTVASMRKRLLLAQEIGRKSLVESAESWLQVDDFLRKGPLDSPLKQSGLRPQVGLIPLGQDPHSGLLEFLHIASHIGPVPERDAEGVLPITDETGCILVLLPGGVTTVGAQTEDENAPHYDPHASRKVRETPVRTVEIAPFFIAKYEFTQSHWLQCTGASNPSFYQTGTVFEGITLTPRHPVESVNWSEANKACWLVGLRLPKNDEWEYAARGGTTTIWPSGNDPEGLIGTANIGPGALNGLRAGLTSDPYDDGFRNHAPVGTFKPNDFGLFDVCGNVHEWCSTQVFLTWKTAAPNDARKLRVHCLRGGGYTSNILDVRAADQSINRADTKVATIGFRPARSIEGM